MTEFSFLLYSICLKKIFRVFFKNLDPIFTSPSYSLYPFKKFKRNRLLSSLYNSSRKNYPPFVDVLASSSSSNNDDCLSKALSTSNFKILYNPGVYLIYNRSTDKRYYGESECLLARFNQHLYFLTNQNHDNRPLQADYTQNPNYFEFLVLDFGPEWSDKTKRVIRQDEYIRKHENNFNIEDLGKKIPLGNFLNLLYGEFSKINTSPFRGKC